MISMNELKQGAVIILEGAPYQVLAANHHCMGRGSSVVVGKLRNLKTGSVMSHTFKPADKLEEAEIQREKVEYLFNHRGEYWFSKPGNRAERFSLKEDFLGDKKNYLKSQIEVEALKLDGEILDIILPIKMSFKIVDAPPNIRGNTAQGGTKVATLETGAKVSVPLFVEVGDVVRVNTESGDYVERAEKG